MASSIIELYVDVPADRQANIFGQFDEHLKLIERTLNVTMIFRDGSLKILGSQEGATQARAIVEELNTLAGRGNTITQQNVNYALSLAMEKIGSVMEEIDKDFICNTIQGRPIKPKTLGQKDYVEQIRKKMIVFGVGPAGTGKTYLAMAMAVTAFRNEEVSRIILTRPAIEAGEKLGFLPGDLQSKVDPYLRPLYDALYQIMGADSFAKNMEKGLIEVAPLAYMRGRTLDNAFIILDEAQNTTPAQMKMFLTRIGFGSKVIITGDASQKDLPRDATSGLDVAMKVLKKIDDIGFCQLTSKDVVRHPLVQQMTIHIEYETDQELGIDYAALASQVADKVLEMEKCPYDGQVNLVLTDNEEIKRVNTEFRNIQAPTDVLSFPMIPFETPADYSVVEEDESYFDLDSDELLLGDIMISVPKVFAQAEEYGHSVTREFCFLVAHSMLHLLGYDHMTEDEAKVMEAKQAAALKELGINR